MEVGIVGLPKSGKTTVFNAATRGRAQVSVRPDRPTLGVAKVHDPRLDVLAELEDSKKITPTEITYLDIPTPKDVFSNGAGIGGEMLTHLQGTDALAIVVRAFDNPSVPHILERVNPLEDAREMLDELAFVDLQIAERRLTKLADGIKGSKLVDRQLIEKEASLLERLSSGLESGEGISGQSMSDSERRILSGFGFLTTKPVILVANLGESAIESAHEIEIQLASKVAGGKVSTASVCGQLEVELASMEADDEREFRTDFGISESGLAKMIKASFEALGLITFFTVGPKETHAWAVREGANAETGAGAIHSDLQRGFIRAEIASYKDFVESNGETGARRAGLLRQEGKNYVLRDGDIVHVLFNV